MNNKGITLVETIVTVALSAIVMSAMYYFIIQGFKLQEFSLEQSQAISHARKGIETMIKEIRETQIADNGAYPIDTAEDFLFIYYSDIDKDNSIERVRYFLEGTHFKKGIIEPRQNPVAYFSSDEVITELSEYVNNGATPIFTFYNGNWPGDTINNPLSSPIDESDIRFVNVKLLINVDPNKAPSNFELESDVAIRNIKDNL